MAAKDSKNTKWKILSLVIVIIAALIGIHLLSMLTLDKSIEYTETTYTSGKVTDGNDGYVIAFVSDTHALPADEIKGIVDNINARGTDVLLLGGDYSGNTELLRESMKLLGGADVADGVYGVEGNHDDYRQAFASMEEFGITPLDNTGVRLADGLYLGGVRDMWNRDPDGDAALSGAQPDDLTVLLSHNPDYAMDEGSARADIMLSGHTHGGQITFFGVLAPELALSKRITAYGQKFMSGWSEGAYGTDVYVSRGAGKVNLVPRVFARPEVVYITLHK